MWFRRLRTQYVATAGDVVPEVASLSSRDLANALRALPDPSRFEAFFRAASLRVQALADRTTRAMPPKGYQHLRSRGDARGGGGREGGEGGAGIDADDAAEIAAAFAAAGYLDPRLFKSLAGAAKRTGVQEFSPRAIAQTLRALTPARTLDSDATLFIHLCGAVVTAAESGNGHRFAGETIVDVVAALARTPKPLLFGNAGAARTRALEVMVEKACCLTREQLGGAALEEGVGAALFSAFSLARIGDDALMRHLSVLFRASLEAEGGGARVRHVATVLHAVASVGHYEQALLDDLSTALIRCPTRAAQAQEVANLAWAAAVLQSLDPALLCWIWRAIDLHVETMSNTELSQVHQFTLNCRVHQFTLNCRVLNISREDVFAAYYGARAAPEQVRAAVESAAADAAERGRLAFLQAGAAERGRLAFLQEALADAAHESSSRFHQDVSRVLRLARFRIGWARLGT
ncbi:hypothetical protein T484DRAFT_1893128 [Baffinella frigidus]|nr:hypothetical protein T484DRAFT_1893128 [Cryptophyta sp. CCMP2293]